MLFAFVSLLIALVAADNCQLEGHTYMSGDLSITFGTSIADGSSWIVQNTGTEITLSSWSPVDGSTDWSTQEAWSSQGKLSCGSLTPPGEYMVTFSPQCDTVNFMAVDDYLCDDRRAFFANVFQLVVSSDCGAEGSSVVGRTAAGVVTDIVFAADGYVLVTAGASALSFHQWQTLGTDIQVTSIYPVMSSVVGSYSVEWETVSCGLEICGISDSVHDRAVMLHDSKFNGFSGNSCPDWADAAPLGPVVSPCNDGQQWNKHPYDCIYQDVEGGCAFCAGRVHGKDINICVPRLGRKCNEIYNQIGTHTYCNLAFECSPASVISFSVILFVSCLVALFF